MGFILITSCTFPRVWNLRGVPSIAPSPTGQMSAERPTKERSTRPRQPVAHSRAEESANPRRSQTSQALATKRQPSLPPPAHPPSPASFPKDGNLGGGSLERPSPWERAECPALPEGEPERDRFPIPTPSWRGVVGASFATASLLGWKGRETGQQGGGDG